VRFGNRKLAGKLAELYGSYQFNELHKQVLLNDNQQLKQFKAVSVKKKAQDNRDVTPLHCACINPNTKYLKVNLFLIYKICNINEQVSNFHLHRMIFYREYQTLALGRVDRDSQKLQTCREGCTPEGASHAEKF
jgi:ankyrin repeat protein